MKYILKNFLIKSKTLKINLKCSRISAFTLVETMVATVIIVIAVSGPLSVAVASSGYVRDTKDNMTSTYLAQEAVDILRYKRDTLYINCLGDNYNTATCPTFDFAVDYPPMTGSSSPKESSWKFFKEQIGHDSPGGHCFTVDGCTYDTNDFLQAPLTAPNLRLFGTDGSDNCDHLYRKDDGDGSSSDDFMYVCDDGGNYTRTHFSRKIRLEDVSTSTNAYIQDYEDDIRITVTVDYVRHNGLVKQNKLVDFLHSK